MTPDLFPSGCVIAHRCVDLSARFGARRIADLVAEGKTEENSLAAMEARFRAGFGIETDLRTDARGASSEILISHDPPVFGGSYPTLSEVLQIYIACGGRGALALNIKDSGLQSRLKPMLKGARIGNYFTFDGAVPDAMADAQHGLKIFARESEIETFDSAREDHPLPNYSTATGVWLDNFFPSLWITGDAVLRHFVRKKDIAIVSPELHPWGRADEGATILRFWRRYREDLPRLREQFPQRRLMICTKFPSLARDFFNA